MPVFQAQLNPFDRTSDQMELKPCPFCGAESEIELWQGPKSGFGDVGVKAVCKNVDCRALIYRGRETLADATDAATKAWNNRAPIAF